MKNIIIAILLIAVSGPISAQSPWVKKKGEAYVKLSEWWTVFDQHYTDKGDIDPNVTTGIYNTFLYAEYGVSDRFTAVFNGAIFSRNVMNNLRSATTGDIIVEGEGLNTIGDLEFALRYGIFSQDSPWKLSATLSLGLPTGTVAGGKGQNLQTGDGEFNQQLSVSAGKSIGNQEFPAYFSLYAAVNNRTQGFSDEFRWGAELGFQPINKLWVTTRLQSVESLQNGDASDLNTASSIFANNSEFLSVGAELSYYLTDKLGLSVGAATAVRGEIIAAAPSYNVGVFLDLQ